MTWLMIFILLSFGEMCASSEAPPDYKTATGDTTNDDANTSSTFPLDLKQKSKPNPDPNSDSPPVYSEPNHVTSSGLEKHIPQLETQLSQVNELLTATNDLANKIGRLARQVHKLKNGETFFLIADDIIQSENLKKNGFCMMIEHVKDNFKLQPYYSQIQGNTWYKFSMYEGSYRRDVLVVEAINADRLSLGIDVFKLQSDQSGIWISLRDEKTYLILLSLMSEDAVPTKSIYVIRITAEDTNDNLTYKVFRLDRVTPQNVVPLTPVEVITLQSLHEKKKSLLDRLHIKHDYDSVLKSKILKSVPKNFQLINDESPFQTDLLEMKDVLEETVNISIESSIKSTLATRIRYDEKISQIQYSKNGFLDYKILENSDIQFHGPTFYASKGFRSDSRERIFFIQGNQEKQFAFIVDKHENVIVAENSPDIKGLNKCDYLMKSKNWDDGYPLLTSVHDAGTEIIIAYPIQTDKRPIKAGFSDIEIIVKRVYVIKRSLNDAKQPLKVYRLQNSVYIPENGNYISSQNVIFTVSKKLTLPLAPGQTKLPPFNLDEIFINRILNEGQQFEFASDDESPFQTDLLTEGDPNDELTTPQQNVNNKRLNELRSYFPVPPSTSPSTEYELLHGINPNSFSKLDGFHFITDKNKMDLALNALRENGQDLFMPIANNYCTKFNDNRFIFIFNKNSESECDILVPHKKHDENHCWKSVGMGKEKNVLLVLANKIEPNDLAAFAIVIEQKQKTVKPSYIVYPMFQYAAKESDELEAARSRILNTIDFENDEILKFMKAVFTTADGVTIKFTQLPFEKKFHLNGDWKYSENFKNAEAVRKFKQLDD